MKQNLRVLRIQFEITTALKDELFTRTGRLKYKMRKPVELTIKQEAHAFIESQKPGDILKNSKIEFEEVEVENDN